MIRLLCALLNPPKHCGVDMEFEVLPRASYVCGRCGAAQ